MGARRLFSFALASLLATLTPAGAALAAEGNLTQEINSAQGVIAEIVECKREDGVLTIRMALRNKGAEDVSVSVLQNRNYDAYYVTAASKKYFVLRDSEKTPLTPDADGMGGLRPQIPKGGTWTWWAKYPAPPVDVKKISYYTPLTAPFDNVPIKD